MGAIGGNTLKPFKTGVEWREGEGDGSITLRDDGYLTNGPHLDSVTLCLKVRSEL